jgi:hypothetical protein
MSPVVDLFSLSNSGARLHPQFLELARSPVHGEARALVNRLFGRMGDPNGHFVEQFQGDGFHSRLFEIACFAYLEEAGLSIDRSYERPDYLVSRGSCSAAVEAVTSNPSTGQGADISLRQMTWLSEAEILEKVGHEFPQRVMKSLRKKLGHSYHLLPHCSDKPLVFMIAPFFEAGAGFYTDDALLYAILGPPHGVEWREAPFFDLENARNVSAVLYCNQFTVSRFFRLATDFGGPGVPETVRHGTCYSRRGEDMHALLHFTHHMGSPSVPKELWSEGVTLFENPNARVPLPRGFLPATCYMHVHNGIVTRDVTDFHPVVSFTEMRVKSLEGL